MQSSGYFWGTGRRKCALARVRIRPGDGAFKVNEREVAEYFPRDCWQISAMQPLKVAGLDGKMDVFVRASGGGLQDLQHLGGMTGVSKGFRGKTDPSVPGNPPPIQ